MKEILGGKLDKAFSDLKITAIKTYECKNIRYKYQEVYQVWELSDEDFNGLCDIKEEDWKDDWGWWRSAEGSNMFGNCKRYTINNHHILAWDGNSREKYDWMNRKYDSLLSYYCEEHGVSTEKNVCALSVDLAKINNMKMSELFAKYQG